MGKGNGFNILAALGLENVSFSDISTNYSTHENQENKDYLEKDLSTRTEIMYYFLFDFICR